MVTPPETAKIYEFRARERSPSGTKSTEGKPGASRSVPSAPPAEFGSGWYHDAAIKEVSPDSPSTPDAPKWTPRVV